MCGIFGLINTNNEVIDKRKVKESANLMIHRGPNSYGQWGIENKIELAHLRLSIIDLTSEGNQPFFSKCNNFVIVFNGEIYNYIEIRETLEKNIRFATKTDTEVLLEAYLFWGDECVNKFNGDWAFAIYNIKENRLFCSRDRFGVKPFYYAIHNNTFIFSSEIKSIINFFPELKKPNYDIIYNYCNAGFGSHTEYTWFNDIFRLQPSYNLILEDGKILHKKYWYYPKDVSSESYESLLKKYRELFINSVKLRMRSDVEVGTTLSSGLDSTSIVSVVSDLFQKHHKTFTATFENSTFDKSETKYYNGNIIVDEAKIVEQLSNIKGFKTSFIPPKNESFSSQLSNLIYYLESGHSSYAIVPLSIVMKEAKKSVTVLLEGQGADELLGGYVLKTYPYALFEYLKQLKFRYFITELRQFKKNYSLIEAIKLLVRNLNLRAIDNIYNRIAKRNNIYSEKLKNSRRMVSKFKSEKKFSTNFDFQLYRSHSEGLVNLLHYGDAISMSQSIESRNPFLDINLVEFTFSIPFQYKIKDGFGKYIHRDAMKDILPDFIRFNPLKFGFTTPLAIEFDSYEKDAIKILLSDTLTKRNLFVKSALEKLIRDHISKRNNNSTILYRILSIELWFRNFID